MAVLVRLYGVLLKMCAAAKVSGAGNLAGSRRIRQNALKPAAGSARCVAGGKPGRGAQIGSGCLAVAARHPLL